MAKVGNHGRIIPRDRELLHHLYCVEGFGIPTIAKRFGVGNKSLERVLHEVGIPTRAKGCRVRKPLCIDCRKVPPLTLKHKLSKAGTGTRCLDCLRAYKARWSKNAVRTRPEVKARRRELLTRWYVEGPIQPKGEEQWIRRAKHLLRTNRRLLKTSSREASQLLSAAFAAAATSPT